MTLEALQNVAGGRRDGGSYLKRTRAATQTVEAARNGGAETVTVEPARNRVGGNRDGGNCQMEAIHIYIYIYTI